MSAAPSEDNPTRQASGQELSSQTWRNPAVNGSNIDATTGGDTPVKYPEGNTACTGASGPMPHTNCLTTCFTVPARTALPPVPLSSDDAVRSRAGHCTLTAGRPLATLNRANSSKYALATAQAAWPPLPPWEAATEENMMKAWMLSLSSNVRRCNSQAPIALGSNTRCMDVESCSANGLSSVNPEAWTTTVRGPCAARTRAMRRWTSASCATSHFSASTVMPRSCHSSTLASMPWSRASSPARDARTRQRMPTSTNASAAKKPTPPVPPVTRATPSATARGKSGVGRPM
mmetsp:Transcript_21369/g.54597  ORF Transcript_21369/g.54597 Transcript_21369/m.54597 type:complete len:289 (+) Transcript_21369:110-976(+)